MLHHQSLHHPCLQISEIGMESAFPKLEESDEARKKLLNAKSISSEDDEKIPADLESKSTLVDFLKNLWSSMVGKVKEKLMELLRTEIDEIRTDVTELMETLHAPDADDIPLDTRRFLVSGLCSRATRLRHDHPGNPILASCIFDTCNLLRELRGLEKVDGSSYSS